MEIYVHTDNTISGTHGLTAHVEREVGAGLSRFAQQVTRVEVHLSDESAGRPTGDDIRCLIEARPEGGNPVTVTQDSGTVAAALTGAIHRLDHLLAGREGKAQDKRRRASVKGHATS